MLKLIKVTGHSLSPEYKEGDFVLAVKIPLFCCSIKAGDTIIFHHPQYGQMIKRVSWAERSQDAVFVTGRHPDSVDSRNFGPISYEMIKWKVIWHIPGPGSP